MSCLTRVSGFKCNHIQSVVFICGCKSFINLSFLKSFPPFAPEIDVFSLIIKPQTETEWDVRDEGI